MPRHAGADFCEEHQPIIWYRAYLKIITLFKTVNEWFIEGIIL